jgi:hypothetical protein
MCWGTKQDPNPYGQEFRTTLLCACCKAPCCCCSSFVCPHIAACKTRKRALNGNMEQYRCCQDYFNNCCFKAGNCCERDCPNCCLCVESFCCLPCAVRATRTYYMDLHSYQSDPCDRRMITCVNCLMMFSCLCQIVACLTGIGRDVAGTISNIVGCIHW